MFRPEEYNEEWDERSKVEKKMLNQVCDINETLELKEEK